MAIETNMGIGLHDCISLFTNPFSSANTIQDNLIT